MVMYRKDELSEEMPLSGAFYGGLKILEREEGFLTGRERLAAAVGPLLVWFRANARKLPWRDKPLPYPVWISEIMLQQTRVEAVKPYFNRFMEELPTVEALAKVSEERLFKLWEGLGYYSRARNLQKAAVFMTDHYNGNLPPSYEELLKLPGVGTYTAGAIASIAFGIPVPAVDGNVLRVVARLLADSRDIMKPATRKDIEAFVGSVVPCEAPGDFNQSLIELGAMVCIPGK